MPMSPRLLRPRATGFNPRSIAGLRAWYDPTVTSSITLNSGNVSEWQDLSGNGFHLTQTTAANQPAYVTSGINSKPALQWPSASGSNTIRLTNSSFTMTRPYTVFAVIRTVNKLGAGVYQATVYDGFQSSLAALFFDGSPAASAPARTNFGTALLSPTLSHPQTMIVTSTAESGGNQGSIRIDGGSATSGTVGTNTFDGLSVGQLRGNPSPLNTAYAFSGLIAELIFYGTSALSASAESSVRRYLGTKWGVTV